MQKPISSVLEKIRKRKLEISKKFVYVYSFCVWIPEYKMVLQFNKLCEFFLGARSMISNSNYDGVERNIRSRDRMMGLDEPERSEENISTKVGEELIAPLGKLSSLAASNVNEDVARSTIFENAHNQVVSSML